MPATLPTTRPNGNGEKGIVTEPGGGLILNFKDASIDAVLDELSTSAGFIIVKEVRPEGRVTLVSKQAVMPNDAVSLLNTVLKNAGYAAIQQGRILKIVARDRAKHANIPVRSGADPEAIEPTDELITQVIPLRFAVATQLKADLQPLVNPEADFTANASSNALVMTDTAANIRRIVQIVNALDTHLADATDVKVYQLQYASAAGAARLINELFRDNQTSAQGGQTQQQQNLPPWLRFGQGGGGGGGGGRGGQQQQQQQQQADGMRVTRVNASSDDRTNTLVVTGPTDTLVVISRVVKELDGNPLAEESVYIYKLKNADSLNIESVVNSLFNGTSSGARTTSTQTRQQQLGAYRTGGSNTSTGRTTTGGTGRTTGGTGTTGGFGQNTRTGATGGAFGGFGGFAGAALSQNVTRTASELAGQVSIIADADTNSLLIRTAPKNYERVKQILSELDRPVAQVLIKVLVAEVTHDNTSDIGAEFSALNLRTHDVTTVTGTGANAVSTTVTEPNGFGQRGGTGFPANLPNPPGGLTVQIVESNFEATIRLLEKSGKLDVLSRPYILASDNQLASITVGSEVPFVTNSRVTEDGQTINSIEYNDIGILLDVIPHINPDGLVILDVAPEISALTSDSVPITNEVSVPIVAKRSAQSRVGVRNGQTVVIGGLMEDKKTETINKVPFLGDIPILGEAFKRRQNVKSKTELLIFLTPHVAADPDLLRGMSQDEVGTTKLVPGAVGPGSYQEHMKGLETGSTTRPSSDK